MTTPTRRGFLTSLAGAAAAGAVAALAPTGRAVEAVSSAIAGRVVRGARRLAIGVGRVLRLEGDDTFDHVALDGGTIDASKSGDVTIRKLVGRAPRNV